jgi:hypothetical protein
MKMNDDELDLKIYLGCTFSFFKIEVKNYRIKELLDMKSKMIL